MKSKQRNLCNLKFVLENYKIEYRKEKTDSVLQICNVEPNEQPQATRNCSFGYGKYTNPE